MSSEIDQVFHTNPSLKNLRSPWLTCRNFSAERFSGMQIRNSDKCILADGEYIMQKRGYLTNLLRGI